MKHAMNSLKHWHGSLHPCQAMLGQQQYQASYARTAAAAAREGKKDWGNCVEQVCKAKKPGALESGLSSTRAEYLNHGATKKEN